MSKNETGGISLFLAVALLALVILGGLLIDITRVSAAKNQAARALDIATLSVLARYDTDLKNEYGIFALHMPSADETGLRLYAGMNLGIETGESDVRDALRDLVRGGRQARLYDFDIENIHLRTVLPISDCDVLERQILEYMKYRAPAALATGVADLIGQARTAAKMADTTKIKVEIDRKLAKIGSEQQDLRDYLYGDIGTTRVGKGFVKNLNGDGKRGELAEEVQELYEGYTEIAREVRKAEIARSAHPDPVASKSDRDMLKKAYDELAGAWDGLQYDRTEVFQHSNQKAVACVEKIEALSAEVLALYERFDESVARFDAAERETPFVEPVTAEVERGRASLIDARSAAEKIGSLNENVEVITAAVNVMSETRSKVLGYNPDDTPLGSSVIWKALMPDFSEYNYDVSYTYEKAPSRGGFADPREYVDDRVTELLGGKKKEPDKKLADIGVDAGQLPSRDVKAWWERLGAGLVRGLTPEGRLEYKPFDADSSFSPDALDVIGRMGEALADGTERFRDACYVGEYVLSRFNNKVRDKYRWAGLAPPEKTAFFDAEVEYILHGNASQSANLFWTKAQLLTTRFAMNFTHVNSDPEKLAVARNTAAALTAWWSSGALVPAAMELIIAAWSMKEAIADVEDLFDGKRVPFIKLAGDWKTHIGVPAKDKPKTREDLKWSYLDYLRIYLLPLQREIKLARINDLIEINTKYAGRERSVRDLYCGLRTDIEVSVNYLFMTAPFMPARLKTAHGRHILNASAARDLF